MIITELFESQEQKQERALFEQWRGVGQTLMELRMSEKQILDLFSRVESGATAGGSNRTMLGKGKDVATNVASTVSDAVKSVLNSIQNSTPVQAVDVAYDVATDALSKVTGGQKGKVMKAIKAYRNLAKQYPKTAGFSKAALVAIAGLATGGAGLPAIAGLTYALDSAIKGDKLSSVLGKGAGAAALAAAGQAISSTSNADTSAANGQFQLPDADAAMNSQADLDAAQDWLNADEAGKAEIEKVTGMPAAQLQDIAVSNDLKPDAGLSPGEEIVPPGGSSATPGAEGFGGGTYTVQAGDQGGYIAQAMGIPFKDLQGLNPQITDWNKLPVGTELQLPPTGDNVGSVWGDGSGASSTPADATAATSTVPAAAPTARPEAAIRGPMGLGNTSIAGMPVIPGQPLNATQMGVADFAIQNGNRLSPEVQAAYNLAKKGSLRESLGFVASTLPAAKMIDRKATFNKLRVQENIDLENPSVVLTAAGTYKIFENIDRLQDLIVEARPEFYRPDMPGGPGKNSKPGIIGRGLNWLDKKAGQIGAAAKNIGHQLTTKLTKEKLKMNWHQAGKPSDSNAIASFLTKQGVPQAAVTDVYSQMGLPTPVFPGGPRIPGFINQATGQEWSRDELTAKAPAPTPAANAFGQMAKQMKATGKAQRDAQKVPAPKVSSTGGAINKSVPGVVRHIASPKQVAAQTAPATPAWANPTSAQYVGRREVDPQQGYSSVKMNAPTYTRVPRAAHIAPAMKTTLATPKAAAPAKLTPAEYIKKIGADALPESIVNNVSKMLESVKSKKDILAIREYIDTNLTRTNQQAFRRALHEKVTAAAAIRRRIAAQQAAQ